MVFERRSKDFVPHWPANQPVWVFNHFEGQDIGELNNYGDHPSGENKAQF